MESILQFDKELFLLLNFDGGEFLDRLFWIVSGKLTWVPLYLLIVFLLYRRYGWKQTVIAVLLIAATVGATDQICNFFKNNVPKLRPTHNPDFEEIITLVNGYRGYIYGTVSAHAATTFGIMTISSSLIRARWFTCLSLVWVLLVCYSRIYIGAHYPLDIFFGALTGIVVGVAAVKLFWFIIRKLRERQERTGS